MRRSFLVAFSLTLFMLLLVLIAAFHFSYQNQQALQQRLTQAHTDRAAAGEAATRSAADLELVQSTRQAAQNALATAEAEAVLLEGQLVTSQQQAEELNRQIDGLTNSVEETGDVLATREATQSALSIPLVTISHPRSDQPLRSDQTVQVIVAASDWAGLSTLHIDVEGEVSTVPVEAGNNLFVFIRSWTPTAAGEFEIQARATNINGQESQTVSRIILVLDAEPDETEE
jgi:hypothetical protein